MFQGDPFGKRLKDKADAVVQRERAVAEAERRRGIAQKQEDTRYAAQQEELRQKRYQEVFSEANTGSRPIDILSESDAQLCAEFLIHMNRRLFRKSMIIAERLPKPSGEGVMVKWSTNAYQIGRLEYDQETHYSELYLCQDGLLRNRSVQNHDLMQFPPHKTPVTRYRALPDIDYRIEFGFYQWVTRTVVTEIIPPRITATSGPVGYNTPSDHFETRKYASVNEAVWQPAKSLEEHLTHIATSKQLPLAELP